MMALVADVLTIRPAVDSDVALIYSSWLRSYWNARPNAVEGIAYQDYQRGQRARIDRLLGLLHVACSSAAPDAIMGWRCGVSLSDGTLALHYVYVRQIYRRQGVAKLLLQHFGWQATHMTPAFARAFPRIPFNPYLLEQT